jgi:hypothetical protein
MNPKSKERLFQDVARLVVATEAAALLLIFFLQKTPIIV